MIIISITVIKNNISVIWLKYSRLVSWFHWTHDVNVASRMPWQGIGAIEPRARKKPVLLGPCPPGYGTQLHRSVLEDKTQLWEWGDQESQSRYAMRWCCGAVVECCGLTSSSSTALWLRITGPGLAVALTPGSDWRSHSHTACNLVNPNWIRIILFKIERRSLSSLAIETYIERNGWERQASGSHKSCACGQAWVRGLEISDTQELVISS